MSVLYISFSLKISDTFIPLLSNVLREMSNEKFFVYPLFNTFNLGKLLELGNQYSPGKGINVLLLEVKSIISVFLDITYGWA